MLRTIIVCTFFGLCLNGCVFMRVKEDIEKYNAYSHVVGNIISEFAGYKPIFIGAFRYESGEEKLIDYGIIYGPGPFEIWLLPGEYYLAAFEDANEDMYFQQDEYVGWYGSPTPVNIIKGRNYKGMDICLRSPEKAKKELPIIYDGTTERSGMKVDEKGVGEIVSLDDPRFSRENGWIGFWEPMRFLKEIGGGVYFLEPYDPQKIPILFVHGLCGHPGMWSRMIENLDRTHFQPWLGYYPSGLRLTDLSEAVAQFICQLQYKYKYKKICIVAHSIGGLITRAAINRLDELHCSYNVELFVSISTPWQGHIDARRGVDYAPVVVPCLYDLAPGSPFITSIHKKPMPQGLAYYLMFSYKSDGSLFVRGNNDGVVTLQSQLLKAAQEEAEKMFGFNETHVTVLISKTVSKKLYNILEKSAGK